MLQQKIESKQIKEMILSKMMKYHNYSYFQTDRIKEQGFVYLRLYNYNTIFDLLFKEEEKEIEKKIIFENTIRKASDNNDVKAIYCLLFKEQTINKSLFKGNKKVQQISIPSNVTEIGDYAFFGCSSLTHISIPSSVTSIGDGAFYGCSSLTEIIIPSSITKIGNNAFYECSSLIEIEIPSSVVSIGSSSFSRCTSLEES